MTNRAVISTPDAPEAIGPYSQAIKVGNTVWLSGQIPLVPGSAELVAGGIAEQAAQAFREPERSRRRGRGQPGQGREDQYLAGRPRALRHRERGHDEIS